MGTSIPAYLHIGDWSTRLDIPALDLSVYITGDDITPTTAWADIVTTTQNLADAEIVRRGHRLIGQGWESATNDSGYIRRVYIA